MADGKSYERAKTFRKAPTPPEARLWAALRRRGLEGLRFRRQHPIGPFILDFFCAEAMLAVEVDGASHQDPERAEMDRRRSAWLATRNIRVIRIAARDVRDEFPHVLDFIGRTALERLQLGSPPPSRRPSGRRATSPRCGEES